jgi:hypothetical protein
MKFEKSSRTTAARVITLLIVLSSVIASGSLIAGPLNQQEIRPAIETWVRYVTADARPDAVIEDMEPYVANGIPIAYVAHLADSGFCICGADDRFLPVYVYSPDGTYDPENEVYQYFLEDMARWIGGIDKAQRSRDPGMSKYLPILDDRAGYWADLASGIISRKDRGLYDGPDQMALDITSVWHQGYPYSHYCPELPPSSGNHCVIGCVAGSIAAIMRYWEWPVTGVANDSTVYHYRWRSGWDSEPLASDPGIPAGWQGGNRLEWVPDEGGKLRMNGYWDQSLYETARHIRLNYVFAGTGGDGIYRSTNDGDNWTEINSGLTHTDVRALAINSDDHIFAGTFGGGAYRSTDNGGNWIEINSGLTSDYVNALAINASDHVFAGTSSGGAYRSTNNGDNWTQINTGLTSSNVRALAINSAGDIFAGTIVGGVHRSTNNGDNWTQINTGLTETDVVALAVNSANHVFAGTSGGGMFRSTNNGDNWTEINTGLTSDYVEALAINSDNHIFAGTQGGGVYRSTNNGDNWTQINSGLTSTTVRALAINFDGHIFAGTDLGGAFRSTNNGDNWTQIDNGMAGTSVRALAINSSGYLTALETLYNRLTQESDVLHADFSATTYQWDLMEDTHSEPIDAGDLAVATLCYHAGVSVQMNYGVHGSGAGVATDAYIDHFRYDSDVEYVVRNTGNYESGFNDMMEEIQWLRPVQYYGWEHVHSWVIFAYNRTFLPDSVQWGMNSVNGSIDWCTFNPIFANHCFQRYITPESVVRFVGSSTSGDGSPTDPYINIESAIAVVPDGTTLIFKAGSDNTFSGVPLVIDRPLVLKGKNAVIRKE